MLCVCVISDWRKLNFFCVKGLELIVDQPMYNYNIVLVQQANCICLSVYLSLSVWINPINY